MHTDERKPLVAVATASPWPPSDGYSLRVHNILAELSALWDVTLVSPPVEALREWPLAAEVRLVEISLVNRWAMVAFSADDRAALRQCVESTLERVRPEVTLLWSGAEFLAFSSTFPPAVADRIDCSTLTFWRNFLHERDVIARVRTLRRAFTFAAYERRVVRTLDASVVVGERDANWLRRLSGTPGVQVIPNGVREPTCVAKEVTTPTVVFSGVLGYRPNAEAATYLVERIWPLIRRGVAEARLVIAGRNPSSEVLDLQRHAGVEVRPDVPDLLETIAGCWVAVAPMRSGSGIKNKVLEAWSLGKPVVMTRLASNGLALSGVSVQLVTDDAHEMANSVVRLLEDRDAREHFGQAARQLAHRNHGWARSGAAMSELLSAVSRNRSLGATTDAE